LAYYLANNLFPGATSLHYAFVGGLSISQALIVAPIATRTTRLFGTRTTLLVGVLLQTTSFVAASFASRIGHLFLTQGLCFGWGMGFLFVASVGISAQWFTTHRSLANGLAAAGSGLGGLVYSLAAQAMLKNLGLSWAFRIFAILALVVNTVCALLLRDRHQQIGSSHRSFDAALFKRAEVVALLAFSVLSMLGYVVLLFSLPHYATSIGLTAQQGSTVAALFNLGQAIGRPPIGYFSDHVGRLNMASTMTFLAGVFCLLIWMFASTFALLLVFALLSGTVAGTFWATCAPVTTEVVGLVHLPSALSITWLVLVVPTTFAEAIGLELVAWDRGSYRAAIVFTGFMYIGAALFLWLVRIWKIGDMEQLAATASNEGNDVDPVASAVTSDKATVLRYQRSPFLKRMFTWQKV